MHPVLALHTVLRMHAPAILCLHSVGDGPDALPVAVFRRLLDGLCERGYAFLTPDDLLGWRVLRQRSVLLTFDDGRRDNVQLVLPMLRSYGVRATFYVCSGLVGRRASMPAHPDRDDGDQVSFDLMAWDELAQLRDEGMYIGSHGASHRELSRLNHADLWREIVGSRRTIEERLGIRVQHFAYPWGRFDERVVRAVQDAGYRTAAAVSVNPKMPVAPLNRFTLPRITVHPAADADQLLRSMSFARLVRRTAGQMRRFLSVGSGAML